MRFVKILGGLLLGLVGIVVLGGMALLIFFDPNDYKNALAQAVKDKTGRELKLEGDLGLKLFPWLAIQVGHTELGNAPGFGNVAFSVIKSADVGVKVWPLLHGELEISRVRLQGVQLNLAKDANGRSNWEDLLESAEASAEPAQQSRIKSLKIAVLTLKDSGVDYVDAASGSHYRISKLDVETGKLEPGEPFDLKLAGLLDQGEGSASVELKLDAKASLDLPNERYSFEKFALDANLRSPATAEKPAGELPIEFRVPVLQANLKDQTLQAEGFELKLGSAARLNGSMAGQKIIDAPAFSGRVALNETAPRELLKTLNIEAPQTRDPQALKTLAFDAAFNAAFNATRNSVDLRDLKLRLDQTNVSGRFAVSDLKKMALRFALSVDQIDLDRYLEPEAAQSAKQTDGKTPSSKSEPTQLPLDLVKKLNAQGTLDIGALTISGVKLSAVKVKIDAADAVVKLDPSQAKLYGGSHRGAMALDARNPVARLSLQEHLSGIDFAPLMLELFESKRFTGRGSANAALTAQGNDTDALFKSLEGKLDFSVAEGAIVGGDLGYEVRRAQALIKREALPAGASTGKTSFKTLKGSATIAKSVLDNRELAMEADYLKVAGAGSLNLQTQAIDYKVNATVGGGQTAEIPVRISGTLADMKIRPDVEARVKAEVKQKVEEKKEEIKGKLSEKLNQWLQKKN